MKRANVQRLGICSTVEPVLAAGAQSNWPKSCRDLKIAIHPGFADAQAFSRLNFRDVAEQALDAWASVIDVRFAILPEYSETRADIFMRPAALPGSTLADSFLAVGRCDVSLRQRYDTVPGRPWSAGQLFTTIGHEVGHALGLGHIRSNEALLYFQILYQWYKPHRLDINQAKRQGYFDPVSPPPPEPPEPPAPPEPPKPEEPEPMNPIFEFFSKLAMQWLEQCIADQGRDKALARLKGRGFGLRRQFRHGLKLAVKEEHGRGWRKYWRANGDALEAQAWDQFEEYTDAEIDRLADEAELQAETLDEDG